jgi:hypothetical protein
MPRSTSENLKILSEPDDPNLWDKINTPLDGGAGAEAGKWLSSKIDPAHGDKGIRSIASAYAESLGAGVDSLSSPLSLGMFGASVLGKTATAAAPYARNAGRAMGAALGIHGGKGVYEGIKEGDAAKTLTSAIEAGAGYLGARDGAEPKTTPKPKPKSTLEPVKDINPGKNFELRGVPDTTENQPGPRDDLRRSTLSELRAYRANPESFDPKRAQALADNLTKRIGSPNAISVAQKIYESIKDPNYVSDVVDPGKGHGEILAAEGEPEMSPYLKVNLGTETPKRAPGVLPETANLGDVGEIGTGKYFTPESKTAPVVDESASSPKAKGKMFGERTNRVKGAKTKRTKPFQPPPARTQTSSEKAGVDQLDELQQTIYGEDPPTKGNGTFKDPIGDVADPKRPYEHTDIKNLKQLSDLGDQGAKDEILARRKAGSEKGSVQVFPESWEKFFSRKGGGGQPDRPLEETDFTPRSKNLEDADKHSPGFAKQFEDWVNFRKAAKVEGSLKKREFADLDADELEGINKFQAGYREGKYKDVQSYFDAKHQTLQDAGVHAGFKENYLPQLWDNPADEVFDAARRLGLKPKFTLNSVLENYQKGIEIGLKPKFKNISDLVGWYEQTANKALADRAFFDHLKENNLIRPKGKAPANGTWVSLDPDHFPIQKFQTGTKQFQGVLMAPKHVGDVINNYLREPSGKVLGYIADKASLGKNLALSAGLPGTGINAHGFNIAARNIMGRGLMKGGAEAAKYLLFPRTASAELTANLDKAPFAMKQGLTLTTEGFELGESSADTLLKGLHDTSMGSTNIGRGVEKVATGFDKGVKGLLEFHNKYFEKPLFQEVIPNLKLKHFNSLYEEMRKQGMSETGAGRSAAQATNALYGGINWEALGRNRDTQNLFRALFLAPDWFESNLRMGKGLAQGLRNPNTAEGKIYGQVAKNIIASYVAANVANTATTGHPMWDNAPGHTLDVQIGNSGKQIRWLRPFGTAADFIRLPIDEFTATAKGDLGQAFQIAKNRLSLPARSGVDLLSNQNRFSKRIYGKDDYGNKIPIKNQALGMIDELTSPFTPQYVRNPIDYAAGNLNAEQAIVGSLEGPFRYSVAPRTRSRSRPRARLR